MRREPDAVELPYLVAFAHVSGIGPLTLDRLVEVFGDARTAWSASPASLAAAVGPARGRLVVDHRTRLDPDALMESLGRSGTSAVVRGTPAYPELLEHTERPPAVLFVRGRPAIMAEPCIALVGTRRMTHYGSRVARLFAEGLAHAGVTVVSGMARGIDTRAHESCLDAGGATVAVLGCGPDVAFPMSNWHLLQRIASEGCVVTEYPPGTPAMRGHFPARNRIIAGLCAATVVIEAGNDSGSLITATIAAEEGRTVCAVPGTVGAAASSGTHALIRAGARVVMSVADVLEDAELGDLARALPAAEERAAVGGEGQRLLEELRRGPMGIDQLADILGASAADISRTLTSLEIRGLAAPIGSEWAAS